MEWLPMLSSVLKYRSDVFVQEAEIYLYSQLQNISCEKDYKMQNVLKIKW